MLTARRASLKLKGKTYTGCVQIVIKYGSEKWPMRVEDIQRLQRAERMMARWMCGVTLKISVTSDELLSTVNIRSVFDIQDIID